jgi:antitoxin MazE
MRRQVAKWGNSLAVRLPVECIRSAGLKEGDEVEAQVTPGGEIRLMPTRVFDKSAFLERLTKLHAKMPMQTESAGAFIRRMRDEDRYLMVYLDVSCRRCYDAGHAYLIQCEARRPPGVPRWHRPAWR